MSDESSKAVQESPLVIGTYNLTEVNVSVAQDLNEDGVSSINMLDELSCLTGSFTVNADGTWNMDLIELNITSITGNLYDIRCGRSINYAGKWTILNNVLNLNNSEFSTMIFNSSTLTESINEDLPGILNRKFLKQ
tara:strand:+ start:36 stop:443 length:408 start_codon:yes stop_codon:yes gene_type:complete